MPFFLESLLAQILPFSTMMPWTVTDSASGGAVSNSENGGLTLGSAEVDVKGTDDMASLPQPLEHFGRLALGSHLDGRHIRYNLGVVPWRFDSCRQVHASFEVEQRLSE